MNCLLSKFFSEEELSGQCHLSVMPTLRIYTVPYLCYNSTHKHPHHQQGSKILSEELLFPDEDWTPNPQAGILNPLPESKQSPLELPICPKIRIKEAKRYCSLGPEVLRTGCHSPVSFVLWLPESPSPSPYPFFPNEERISRSRFQVYELCLWLATTKCSRDSLSQSTLSKILQDWSCHRGHSVGSSVNKPICFPRTILKSLQVHGLAVVIHQPSPHGCPPWRSIEPWRPACVWTLAPTLESAEAHSLFYLVWFECGASPPKLLLRLKAEMSQCQELKSSRSPSSPEKTTAEARIGLIVTAKADAVMKQGSPTCTQHISLSFNSCHHLRQHGSLTTYRHPILNRQNMNQK